MDDLPNLPHVLLAEDDAGFRELLASELCDRGYRVTALKDGRELLRRLIRSLGAPGDHGVDAPDRPDLVVSDVRMPGYDGLAVAQALDRAGEEIPVILISAFADDELRARAAQAHAFAVVEKPFEIDALLELVDRACSTGTGATRLALFGAGGT